MNMGAGVTTQGVQYAICTGSPYGGRVHSDEEREAACKRLESMTGIQVKPQDISPISTTTLIIGVGVISLFVGIVIGYLLSRYKITRKNSKKHASKKKIIYTISGFLGVGLFLLALSTVFYWQHNKTSQPREQISIIDGIVTDKPPVIADSTAFITVGGVTLKVTESGLKPAHPQEENFSMDIFSIKRGDFVEVHFLSTGNNKGTLNCRGCFIKKDGVIFKPTRNGKEL